MASEACGYCRGVRLVGWSGAGPILCPECSRDQDAFTVITQAWREQRAEVARLSALLSAAQEMREVLREVEWGGKSTNGDYPCCPECGGIWDVREKYPDHEPIPQWAGTTGHAPDCRLARLLKWSEGE